jgi:hypothetical protein
MAFSHMYIPTSQHWRRREEERRGEGGKRARKWFVPIQERIGNEDTDIHASSSVNSLFCFLLHLSRIVDCWFSVLTSIPCVPTYLHFFLVSSSSPFPFSLSFFPPAQSVHLAPIPKFKPPHTHPVPPTQ